MTPTPNWQDEIRAHASREGVELTDAMLDEIAGRLDRGSDGTLRFTLASLYATLYRLEERDLVRGRWVERTGQRRRRCYRITDKGRRALAAQRDDWSRFIAALTQIAGLRPASAAATAGRPA